MIIEAWYQQRSDVLTAVSI